MVETNHSDIIAIIEDAGVVADIDKLRVGGTLKEAGVDSLDLASILLGIEEKYKIKIPDEDIGNIATVAEIINYLSSK